MKNPPQNSVVDENRANEAREKMDQEASENMKKMLQRNMMRYWLN